MSLKQYEHYVTERGFMNRSEVHNERQTRQTSPWKTDESSLGLLTELRSPGVPDALAETWKTQATNKSTKSNASAYLAAKRRSLNAYGAITYHEKTSFDHSGLRPRKIARKTNQSPLTQE
jgi:hypothetical protein